MLIRVLKLLITVAILEAVLDHVGAQEYIVSLSEYTTQMVTSTAGVNQQFFGYKVTMSSDGNTALIMSQPQPGSSPAVNSIAVFNKTGGGYKLIQTIPAPTVQPTSAPPGTAALAMTADGDAFVVVTSYDIGATTQTMIYRRSAGGSYSVIAQDLQSAFHAKGAAAISDDGSTIVAGGSSASNTNASALMYGLSGSTLTGPTRLNLSSSLASVNFNSDKMGSSLCLSGDGATLAVAAIPNSQYAFYVFKKGLSSTWIQLGEYIYGSGSSIPGLAMSSNGNTILAGGDGFVLVWIAQGNTYVQVQKIASPSIYITFGQGAQSVFLNRPGTVAIIGDTGTGVSYVYSMNSSNLFTLVSGNLTQYNTSIAVQFGASVAASDDITHSIHSGQLYNSGEGAVWFFGVQSAAITQSPTLSNSTASPTRSSAVDLLQGSVLSWCILSLVVMNSCL